ncbi:neuronal acetylcholine receptor subunit alpha-3 [Plakobranchus ocellatus]|uniref:Neuronal acetylcholine receptor subunit alpha-3 n=1 Tax=Plakobranchus ocellatus TaxID=259542 RepID=A0AAV4BFY6_9GAST|nr:neuronal acetylcholine receptor subunit alpha-3 [Plakobranchus ocellatus]
MLILRCRQFVFMTVLVWGVLDVSLVPVVTQAQLYQLVDDLFASYKPEVRPTPVGKATHVNIATYLLSIQNLDEKSQVLESSIMVEADWLDDHLSWDEANYGNVTYFFYPQKKVWLPDVVIENSLEGQRQLGYDESVVMVDNSGLVTWKHSQFIKTGCDIDMTYFPFDTQVCNIIVSTWMSTKDDIVINHEAESNGLNLTRYSVSGNWELVSTELENLPNENGLTRLQFKITLKRLGNLYAWSIFSPVYLLSTLTSFLFLLPAPAGEKIAMSITLLLAYTVYLTITADIMPRSSLQVSYLAMYISMLLSVTSFCVVLSVIVVHIHHKTSKRSLGWKSRFFLHKLQCICCINIFEGEEEEETSNRATPKQEDLEEGLNGHRGNRVSSHHSQSKAAVAPLQDNAAVSPSLPCTERKEEVSWPKLAKAMDRFLLKFTFFFVNLINFIFSGILLFGS